jgi:hypothetical protein
MRAERADQSQRHVVGDIVRALTVGIGLDSADPSGSSLGRCRAFGRLHAHFRSFLLREAIPPTATSRIDELP